MEIGYNSYSCGIPPELEYLDIAGANLSGVMPQGHLLMALLLYWWILLVCFCFGHSASGEKTFKEALVEQSVFSGDAAFILQEVDLLDHDEDGRGNVRGNCPLFGKKKVSPPSTRSNPSTLPLSSSPSGLEIAVSISSPQFVPVDVIDSLVPPYDAHPSSLGSPPSPFHLDPPPPSVGPRAPGDSVPHSLNAQ
ncbi:hypothetical protein SUGI_0606210 [Cryptomeria japonica]|nr:hypothetical protein SUGI_0606210 [Cryptomeria japonica]